MQSKSRPTESFCRVRGKWKSAPPDDFTIEYISWQGTKRRIGVGAENPALQCTFSDSMEGF